MAKAVKVKTPVKAGLSGIGGLRTLDEFEEKEKIQTGIYNLDKILKGGIPKGTIAEAFGPEAGGKSCIALQLVGQAQKHGECVYYDLENAFDREKAKNSNVDISSLYFGNPDSGEKMFTELEEIVGATGVSCVVIDSVAAIVTEAQLAGDYGDQHVAQVARLLSAGISKLNDFMRKNNPDTIVFFINQLREKVNFGGGFGPTTYTPGGRALKYYSSTRLKVARLENISVGSESAKEVVGQKVIVENVKSRFAPPFKKATFDLYYDTDIGVSNESSIFDEAKKAGIVSAAGSWYTDTTTGEALGQGKQKCLDKMREDTEITERFLVQLALA